MEALSAILANAKLAPVYWIAGVLMMYAAIGFFLVFAAEGVKYRCSKTIITGIASLLPAFALSVYLQADEKIAAGRFFLLMAAALIGLAVGYFVGPRRVTDWKRIKQRKEYARKSALHLVLLTGAVIFVVPFVWLVTTSLKEEDETFKYPPVWIPTRQVKVDIGGQKYPVSEAKIAGRAMTVAEIADLEGSKKVRELTNNDTLGKKEFVLAGSELTKVRKVAMRWENYSEALDFLPAETHKGLLYVWNTVYITLLSILGTILSSSLVAYSFARLRWPGRDTLFGVLLATMMLPGAVTMIPVFLIFRSLGWVDTLKPLWIPSFFGGAFSVFLLRQFFLTIPTELEEAARIDGCSYFGIYWRIMLPLIKPALAALTIMTFMGSWNNFMGPLIYINSPEKMTLAYGLQLFQGAHGAEYGLLMAASTLVMLPVLMIFFFTQRYFIQGITLTGIKG